MLPITTESTRAKWRIKKIIPENCRFDRRYLYMIRMIVLIFSLAVAANARSHATSRRTGFTRQRDEAAQRISCCESCTRDHTGPVGFLSTAAKKHGLKIESAKTEAGDRVYPIAK